MASGLSALALPQVFAPAEAADVLRSLGLTGMTECALRTRAYRKQVPFHTNGRRIVFTLDDLREIAEGQPHRPAPPEAKSADHSQRKPPMVRRSLPTHRDHPHADPWRAHIPHDRRTGRHRDNDSGHPPAAEKAPGRSSSSPTAPLNPQETRWQRSAGRSPGRN